MFNIIVSNFIVLYDFICMISCLPVITYAFGRWFYPMRLTCTFKVYISVFMFFLELKPMTLRIPALVLPTELQEISAVICFCPHAALLKNDAWKIDSCIDMMHYAFQQCYYKAFSSSFLSDDMASY